MFATAQRLRDPGTVALIAAWTVVLGLVLAVAVFVLVERLVSSGTTGRVSLALPPDIEHSLDLAAEPLSTPIDQAGDTTGIESASRSDTGLAAQAPALEINQPIPEAPVAIDDGTEGVSVSRLDADDAAGDIAAQVPSPTGPAQEAAPEGSVNQALEASRAAAAGASPEDASEPATGRPDTDAAGAGHTAAGAGQGGPLAGAEPQQAALTDGGVPAWQRFGNTVTVPASQPRIAVVITGLGLSAAATEAAIRQLPAGITLSFSPYARQLNQWIALARVNGHEVMLDLPMEPASYPDDDPGPHALLTGLDTDQNLERLDWVLHRANSYVGVAAYMGSRFTASETHLRPVLEELHERGLMFLDNQSNAQTVSGRLASRLGLPFVINNRAIDRAQASRVAINSRLTEIERIAQEQGQSVAVAQPYPVTIERLRDWAQNLESRGFALVPITAVAAQATQG